jgi:hypothetical protein
MYTDLFVLSSFLGKITS